MKQQTHAQVAMTFCNKWSLSTWLACLLVSHAVEFARTCVCVCACPCSTQSLRCVCRPFRLQTSCELSFSDVITQCVWHTGPDSVCSQVCALSVGYTAPNSEFVEIFRGVCTPTLQNRSDTLLPGIETMRRRQLLVSGVFEDAYVFCTVNFSYDT